MSEKEIWFSLGRRALEETVARLWRPGDGVRCSFARYQRREPCGPPAAVMDFVHYRHGEIIEKRIRRVACAEHLAGKVGALTNDRYGNFRQHSIDVATKRATDEVVAKHWKQFEGAYAKFLDEEKKELLQHIPEPLKKLIEDALDQLPDEAHE